MSLLYYYMTRTSLEQEYQKLKICSLEKQRFEVLKSFLLMHLKLKPQTPTCKHNLQNTF